MSDGRRVPPRRRRGRHPGYFPDPTFAQEVGTRALLEGAGYVLGLLLLLPPGAGFLLLGWAGAAAGAVVSVVVARFVADRLGARRRRRPPG